MRRTLHLTFALVATLATGCLGSVGSGTGDPTPSPGMQQTNNNNTTTTTGGDAGTGVVATRGGVTVTTDASADMRLNTEKQLTLTLSGTDGFTGMVQLSAESLPTGVTATFEPASVMLSATPASVKLTLKATQDADASQASVSVKAVSGGISGAAAVALNVLNEFQITIPAGADVNSSAGWGGSSFSVKSGTTIVFVDNDPTPPRGTQPIPGNHHQVHAASPGNGLPHEDTYIKNETGGEYRRVVTGKSGAPIPFHCHNHGDAMGAVITIK